MKKLNLVLVAVSFLCFGIGISWAAASDRYNVEMLKNSGFEGGFNQDGIATKWSDNSAWAPVKVAYSGETVQAHNGKYAQKIECKSWQGGAVQFNQGGLNIIKGKTYKISLWLKGNAAIEVLLRKGPAPYNAYLRKSFFVSNKWKKYSFEGLSSESDPKALLVIRLISTGTVFLDDVSCMQVKSKLNLDYYTNLTPPQVKIPPELFGLHIHPNNSTIKWPSVPFKTWRLHDARVAWPDLEPVKGQWNFKLLDYYLDLAKKKNVDVIIPLEFSPTWASARPEEGSPYNKKKVPGKKGFGWAAEPKNIADWKNYVSTVAKRYKGKAHYYEVWNEPNTEFFTGTIEQLIELHKEAYKIIKKVDPSNKIVFASIVNSPFYLETFFQKGGAKWVDIIGYHFYSWGFPEMEKSLNKLLHEIYEVKKIMIEYNVKKPLWNTEAGWFIKSKRARKYPGTAHKKIYSAEEAGALIAQAYIINWAAGVKRYYYYAWNNGYMGLVERPSGTPKQCTYAYKEIYKWLVGKRMKSCKQDKNDTWIAKLVDNSGRQTFIVWNSNKEIELDIKGLNIKQSKDLYGNVKNLSGLTKIKINYIPTLLVSSKKHQ
ncbi:MAG: carbohydrate binding domain-containing protein [Victivallaceae bacterium]|nr:carbohydrate binding domain-containing protein [Victivallaceae bacterium]